MEIGIEKNDLYSAPIVRKMMKVEESERSIGDYYTMLNNLNTVIEGLIDHQEDQESVLNLSLKLGIVEYFLAFLFHKNVCFIDDHLKHLTKRGYSTDLDPNLFFKRAKEIDPHDENILYCLAMYFLHRGDNEDFFSQKKLLETHHPNSLWLRLVKGREFEERKDYQRVIEYFTTNLHRFPENHVTQMYALRSIFRAAEKMKDRDIELEYIKLYNESKWGKISKSGYSALAFYYLSAYFEEYDQQGGRVSEETWNKLDEAISLYTKCLEISSDNVYYYVSFIHYIRDEKEKCFENAARELRTNPYSISTLHLRISMCTEVSTDGIYEEEDFDQALSDIQRIQEMVHEDKESVEAKKRFFTDFGVEKVLRCRGWKRLRLDMNDRVEYMMNEKDYEVIDFVRILDTGCIRTLKFFKLIL